MSQKVEAELFMRLSLASILHRVAPTKPRLARTTALAVIALLIVLAAPSALAQQANPAPTRPSIPGMIPMGGNGQLQDPSMHRMLERMARERNDARQKQIVADSARLLKLAKQLNADVAKSNKNTLSVTVVKEAAQIEKLAKSIKENMSEED